MLLMNAQSVVPIDVGVAKNHQATKWFDIVAMAFIMVLLISNIAAQKLIRLGPFTFTGGIVLFPVSYVIGDVLTEVYGYARSRRVIWAGLFANIFMAAMVWIVVQLPPADNWHLQREFSTIFGLIPRIVIASVVGYFVGELANAYILAKLKLYTEGRWLFVRTLTSSLVGEGIDTGIFVVLAFGGVFPKSLLIATAFSGWFFKLAYEIVATPLTYLVVGLLKRQEGFDTFDRTTDFSPFRF